MKCRGLFLANDVVYLPITDESASDMMKDIKSHAFYNKMKIKTEQGFFIRQEPLSVEKVIRCEVLEREKEIKKTKITNNEEQKRKDEIKERKAKRQERNIKIIEDFKRGLPVREIAEKYKMSRQSVYNVVLKTNE